MGRGLDFKFVFTRLGLSSVPELTFKKRVFLSYVFGNNFVNKNKVNV